MNAINFPDYSNAIQNAIEILSRKFDKTEIGNIEISEGEFKKTFAGTHFVWKQNDIFSNHISEIFFNHALSISEKMKEVGRLNFKKEEMSKAPWDELNELFEELKFDYRFK